MTASAFDGAAARPIDPDQSRGRGASDTLRSFVTAAQLGWRTEANWTDPVLFFIYSVAKPVSGALILVVMLEVVGGASTRAFRGYVVVGTALWAFVQSGMAGLAMSILDDRERYRMLKYVVVSPSSFLVVVTGRGVARIAVGATGAVITLAVGVLLLGVRIDLGAIDWPLLAVSTVVGTIAITAFGVLLAAVCLQTRQESWSYPETVAGAMFLLTGAVFPIAVLPPVAQVVGLVLPLTWWIEGTRQALMPGSPTGIGGPGSVFTELTGRLAPSSAEIVAALLVTGAVGTLGAAILFRISERRARDRGLLDRTTGS